MAKAKESDKKVYKDVTLLCKECGKGFTFTAKEQQFYVKQGFEHVPTRCHECRQQARERRDKGHTFYPIKCKITGKVGRLPIEPDDPKDVYSAEVFEEVFAQKGRLVDPTKEPDHTDLIKQERAKREQQEQSQPVSDGSVAATPPPA